MFTPKIQALFKFIEYLHSNIDNFKKYENIIEELLLLNNEKLLINRNKNFSDKIKFDELQIKKEERFKVIEENIIQPIFAKANELNICDLNSPETLWNWNSPELHELQKTFQKNDLPEIFTYKEKYIEFKTEIKRDYFQTYFFDNLDETLQFFFNFFSEPEQKEKPIIFNGEAFKASKSDCCQALKIMRDRATEYFNILERDFNNKYPVKNSVCFSDELQLVQEFINLADIPEIRRDAFKIINGVWINSPNNKQFEFTRLKYGFYEQYLVSEAIFSTPSQVHAMYFMFKEWLEGQLSKQTPLPKKEEIDLIKLYESVEIEKSYEPKVIKVNTLEDKKNYFNRASIDLTIQYLTHFKKETYLLNNKRKLDYINSLNIEHPKALNTESSLHNQTVFEAQNNYYEFIVLYRSLLEIKTNAQTGTKTEEETFNFINNSDNIKPTEIYKHFKDGLVEKGYLTKQEFTEYLKDIEEAFNSHKEYQQANELIDNFFSDKPTEIDKPIFVKNGNIKKLAFALGEVWRSKKNGTITYEYLEFYKKAFSIFSKQRIEKDSLFGCPLYKYSISKT